MLDPGWYQITPMGGAHSYDAGLECWWVWGIDVLAVAWPNNVGLFHDAGSASCSDPWFWPTADEALAAVAGKQVLFEITGTEPVETWFYIQDPFCADNVGAVSAVLSPVVP